MTGLEAIWVLRVFEGLTLLVGAVIAFASFRAYARSHDRGLAWLGAGFVLVTIASALAGVLYEVITHDLLTAWTVSATVDFVGFCLILYSIVRSRQGPEAATLPPSSGAGLFPSAPPSPPSTPDGSAMRDPSGGEPRATNEAGADDT